MINAGIAARVALALQETWGEKATEMSTLFSFTSENLKLIKEKKEEDALVGAKTTGRLDSMGRKAAGEVSGLVKPLEIGYWLAATLGQELNVTPVNDASTVFSHRFIPVEAGANKSLKPLTIAVDRVLKTYVYEGAKVNEMKLSAKVQDYLRASFSIIARDEVESSNMTFPARTALKAFKFLGGEIRINNNVLAEVTGCDLTYTNNLEDNLFVMDGQEQMAEIEPQKRDISLSLECLRTSATEALRSSYFLNDIPMSVILTFESDELPDEDEEDLPYKLIVTLPNAYFIEDPSEGVPGAERLKMSYNLKATQQNNTEAIYIDIIDGNETKYALS